MLFTSFPLLRGDVYKGLGAFFVVVLLLGFPPPPRKSPSPFIFYALEKQNWNKIKKKNHNKTQTPKPHYQKKKKKRGSGSILSSPLSSSCKSSLCWEQMGWFNPVWAGGGGGVPPALSPRSAWLLGAIFPKSLPASENFQLSNQNALAEHTVLMGNRTRH